MRAGSQSKPVLDLIEEATHVLRAAAVGTLALYYLGTAPFVLALLYFWADMSRNPFAEQHLAEAAFAVAALFVWMKFWQALFARRMRARLAGATPASLRAGTAFRMAVAQTTLQPLGLAPIGLCISASIYSPALGLLFALAVGATLPLFYNITAVGDGTAPTVREVFKKAWRLWMLWPSQNLTLLVILYLFGFCVFLSLSIFCGSLPGLLQTLFGVQSVFTQSPGSLLNSTFFAAMFGLAYLCVDPILKTVFTLRCFYGESLKSGEDLKAELRGFSSSAQVVAVAIVLGACGFGLFSERSWSHGPGATAGLQRAVDIGRRYATHELRSNGVRGLKPTATGMAPLRGAWMDDAVGTGPGFGRRLSGVEVLGAVPPHPGLLPWGEGTPLESSWTIGRSRAQSRGGLFYVLSGTEADSSPDIEESRTRTTTIEKPETISSPDLDHAINQTIHERKYTWRMPRDAAPKDAKQGMIGRFFDNVAAMLRKGLRAAFEWLRELMRKLFPRRQVSNSYHSSGIDWMSLSQALLFVLITVVACALAIFIYRLWQGKPRLDAVASEPVQKSVPDITDENVGADQMPEDGWTRLGRELLERGEFRLALRAFYLASLAHLAQRSLITLARFKSNHEYERELRRRGHSFPDLLSIFGDNLPVFERSWYGRHDVNGEMVNDFAAKVERMKGAA